MATNKITVNGILQRTYVPNMGGFKYDVKKGTKYFNTPEEAVDYADRVMELTGQILRVK